MTKPTDVDRLRKEALDALRALGSGVSRVQEKFIALIRDDPLITADEGPVNDEEFMIESCDRLERECQTLLYLLTGLYGREAVAAMSEVADDAETVQ